jgi:hypothetical protein
MNKYRALPDTTKAIIYFNEWIMWSISIHSEDFETDYYLQYEKLRHWCVNEIIKNGVSYKDIPTVTIVNQNEVFKRARRELDLRKFRDISTHDFYVERNNNLIEPKAR